MHHGYSETTNSLSILSSSSFKDDLGYYHVVGEVKSNSTTDSMNYVKVVSTFYDNAGKVVGTDFTYTNVDVLGSAEKSSFEIILNDAQQSQRVSSYKLSVSGDSKSLYPAAICHDHLS